LGNDSNVCEEINLIIPWCDQTLNSTKKSICFAGLFLFVVIVFHVYHFLKFYLPTKNCHGCWQKEWTTKDCGLSSHDCCSDFVILALHIKKISIWECERFVKWISQRNSPTEIHE
jgi:hypothetical protein